MVRLIAAVVVLAGSGSARAQTKDAVDAYCDYLEASTAAERTQLLAPTVFGRAGIVQGGSDETGDGTVARATTARTTLGVLYSFNNLEKARRLERARAAECERLRADAALRRSLNGGADVGRGTALEARTRALETRLPLAVERLARAREARRLGQLRDPRLVATRVQVEELRHALREAKGELEELRARPAGTPEAQLLTLLHESRSAGREEALSALELRLTRWWDLQVSAGYDELWGIDQSVPVFATAQLELNVGRLFVGTSRREAAAAYARFDASDGSGLGQKIAELRASLDARRAAASERLQDVEALLGDIRQRQALLDETKDPLAAAYAQDLWFRETELTVERAELTALNAALEAFGAVAFEP